MTQTILRIDSSASGTASVTSQLNDQILAKYPNARVITRDLSAQPLPQIDAEWSAIRGLPDADLTDEGKARLALSDQLIAEIAEADLLVIAAPLYNFGVPASLKAWIDLVARPGRTFSYSASGPEGLMTGKRAIVTFASGGTPMGSDADFGSDYMKLVLGFIGITDVDIISADKLALDADASLKSASTQIDSLAA